MAQPLTDDVLEKVLHELIELAQDEGALNANFDRNPAKRRAQFKDTLVLACKDHSELTSSGDVTAAEERGWMTYVQCMGTALMRANVPSGQREHILGAIQKMEGLIQVEPPPEPLDTQRIVFSTLNASMQDSSSTMMTHVKATLQQAQEITTKVDEAERVAEEATKFAQSIRETHAHIERQRASRKHLYRFRQSREQKDAARQGERLGEELASVPAPIAASLTKEIQLSVLWTQQLLDLVQLAESQEAIEPGQRLHPQAK